MTWTRQQRTKARTHQPRYAHPYQCPCCLIVYAGPIVCEGSSWESHQPVQAEPVPARPDPGKVSA